MDGQNKDVVQEHPLASGRWILVAMIFASSMAVIDASALNVALPALQKGLEASAEQLLWVVNGYALLLASLILTGGALGDLYGRKRVMLVGMVIFLLASLTCGLSPSIRALIFARCVQGIGAALMIPGSLAILSAYFSAQERGRAIGIWSSAGALMVVFGPVLGGLLANQGLWRLIFLINLPLGILTMLIIIFKVPESRNPANLDSAKASSWSRIDFPGALLITLSLGLLTYGFTTWSEGGFSWAVRLTILGGLGVMAAFINQEARSQSPMMPLSLFKSKVFSGSNLLTFFLYGALTVSIFFLSINLVQVQGYSPSKAGLAFLAFPAPLVLLSRYAGSLADRFGPKWLLVAGPLVTAAGFMYLSQLGLTSGPTSYFTTFFPGLLLFGLGMSMTVVPLTSTVMGSVDPAVSGTASGINNAVTRVASVLTLAVVGAMAILLNERNVRRATQNLQMSEAAKYHVIAEAKKLAGAHISPQIPKIYHTAVEHAFRLAFTQTYSAVMWVCALLAGISALMAWMLISRPLPSTPAS